MSMYLKTFITRLKILMLLEIRLVSTDRDLWPFIIFKFYLILKLTSNYTKFRTADCKFGVVPDVYL